MAKRIFDIARLKPGSRSVDRDPRESAPMLREGKAVKRAITELSVLTLDEMLSAINSLDDDSATASAPGAYGEVDLELDHEVDQEVDEEVESEEEISPGDEQNSFDPDKKYTLDEVYGLEDADQNEVAPSAEEEFLLAYATDDVADDVADDLAEAPQEQAAESKDPHVEQSDELVGDARTEDSDNQHSEEVEQSDWEKLLQDDPEQDSPISGVVRDEIVLSLLQSGIVTMSQVFDAIRNREEGKDLWRVLAEQPELDPIEIGAAVASQQGYDFQSYLDTPPTKAFLENLLEVFPGVEMARFISAGLLPIALDIDPETTQYQVIVLSSDPTKSGVQSVLLAAPIAVTCRFAPFEVLENPLSNLGVWMVELGFEAEEEILFETEHSAADEIDRSANATESEESLDSEEDAGTKKPALRRRSDRESRSAMDRVVKQLIAEGLVEESNVEEATQEWEAQDGAVAMWRIVADLPGVSREVVYETAARVYAFKHEVIGPGRPDHDFVKLTMETLAETHYEEMLEMLLVPFEHTIDFDTGTGRIVFITPDPTRPEINRLVHDLDLGRFELRYASESDILKLYDELFPRKNEYLERIDEDTDAYDLGMSYDEGDSMVDEDALEAEISRSKLINLFEASLVEAVRQGASDIHLFPNPNRQVEIHFRTDGRLKKWHTEDKVHPEAFLAVVKDNSTNVDRFDRESAQDGFIQRDIDGALIRFRVSILPIATANQEMRAESIVIRILDDRKVLTDITKLGMLDVAMERFDKAIRQPHGMVILTGPTGSGKSTTLVAALYQVVTSEVNVLTVEDPVEYIIRGVRQIKLSHKLDLEGALRAILRHDPDIVMVGEMRDKHTAELAIKLANTGHLTFSTLHTNDAPAAVSRLYKMGVEPFLIAYAINLVVAQRLIRQLCSECKVEDDDPDLVMMRSLGFTDEQIEEMTVFRPNYGSGCATCGGNGYKGRRAVCEALYFTREIRNMIAEAGNAIDEDAIRDQAVKDGMLTLQDSAMELVKQGHTSLQELVKMTASH